MRVLLFTGKGGVGKTSVAAATALRAADTGRKTLVLSTDPAHSLADALDTDIGNEPTPVTDHLDAQQLDARARLEENWREIQRYLIDLLRWAGAKEVAAEELSVLPGLEEVFALIDVHAHVRQRRYDMLVIDCAPTAETLRLLSLPDVLGWYLERVFGTHRRIASALRPVVGGLTDMPLPADRVLGSVERLARSLDGVRTVLTDQETTAVRLVVNPQALVIAEARRTATHLALFGYHVDGVVMNRMLPEGVSDPFFDGWREREAGFLREVEEGFGGAPVLRVPLLSAEPVGTQLLRTVGTELYRGLEVGDVLHRASSLRVDREDDELVLSLALPHIRKGDVALFRRGDDLSIKVGAYNRTLALPAALARGQVVGAGLSDGRLRVRFATQDTA